MCELKYPKTGWKKKRKKHAASILHCKDGTCYLCMKLEQNYSKHLEIQEHHVSPGNPNRQISEENGFKVYLCRRHHTDGPEAVHNNKENMQLIKEDCQRVYEETHTREEFMKLIKRNYL